MRKPYANAVLEMRRYASFIATSNLKDLLTDPSGSRRFICIEVIGTIDTSKAIDYEQLYAQAMHELDHNERYWFDQAEERIMTENNREFEQVSLEEQLFYRYFRPAKEEENGEWLSPAEILEDIKKNSAIPISNKRVSVFGNTVEEGTQRDCISCHKAFVKQTDVLQIPDLQHICHLYLQHCIRL